MPFKSVSDLPGAITDNLPKHGQEIYMAAYNSAWDEYKDKNDRREETAHRVAWSAVKNVYEKNLKTGKWEPKTSKV